jgi:hypothetical protein
VPSEHGKQSFSGLALRRTLWNGTIMEEAAVNRSSFSVTPLSAHTGAEVAGLDVSGPVDEEPPLGSIRLFSTTR